MIPLGDGLMVRQRTLTPLIKVRTLVPQPSKIKQLHLFQKSGIDTNKHFVQPLYNLYTSCKIKKLSRIA